MKKLFVTTFLIGLIVAGERLYDSAYNKGRMDAQNDFFFKERSENEILIEEAVENARWECTKQKEDLIDRCNRYCGKFTI